MLIDVLGMLYSIELADSISPALRKDNVILAGCTYFDVKQIYINKQLYDRQKIETFIHELTHAILYESQLDTGKDTYTEEELCRFNERYLSLVNARVESFERFLGKEDCDNGKR